MLFKGMGEAKNNITPENAGMSGTEREREIICTFSSSSSQQQSLDEADDRKGKHTTLES